MKTVARYYGEFPSKFGVPKQAGLVPELQGVIVLEPEYRNPDFIRGIEDFDYLWLLWEFSENSHESTSPVVRPPVLGGNKRVGVFASRSPFRPNNIGLSSVRLEKVVLEPSGTTLKPSVTRSMEPPLLVVSGADLVDGTPIYDIKPYLEYADSHVGIRSGFVDSNPIQHLQVEFLPKLEVQLSQEEKSTLTKVLSLDPRPHYHHSVDKVYGMPFRHWDIHFQVNGKTLTVTSITPNP